MLKTCKCGNPIYDEEHQSSDKCYQCVVKELDEIDKRLFTGLNYKEEHGLD